MSEISIVSDQRTGFKSGIVISLFLSKLNMICVSTCGALLAAGVIVLGPILCEKICSCILKRKGNKKN